MFVEVSEGFVGNIGDELKYNKKLRDELATKFSKEKGNFTPDDMMEYLKKTNLMLHIKTMLSLIPEGKEAEFKEAICSAAERRKLPPVNYRKMLEIAHKGGFAEEFERVHALDKVINDRPTKTKTLFVKSTEELEDNPNLSEYTGIVFDSGDGKTAGGNIFVAKSNEDLQANPDLTKYGLVICDFEGKTEFADLSKLCKRMIIKGDIDLCNRNDITKISDISESTVYGYVNICLFSNLSSGNWIPKKIKGYLNCNNCHNLKSLDKLEYVGKSIYCNDCHNLESLDNIKYVGGAIYSKGCEKLDSSLYLIKDSKPYDLFNLPQNKEFIINDNLDLNDLRLEKFPNLSNVIVKGYVYCLGNNFNSAKGLPKYIERRICCDDEFQPMIDAELKRREKLAKYPAIISKIFGKDRR